MEDRNAEVLSIWVGLVCIMTIMLQSANVLPRTQFIQDFLGYVLGTFLVSVLVFLVWPKQSLDHRHVRWTSFLVGGYLVLPILSTIIVMVVFALTHSYHGVSYLVLFIAVNTGRSLAERIRAT